MVCIFSVLLVLLWNECLLTSFFVCVLRYALVLHAVWSINSFAHRYVYKPYDKNVQPSENLLVAFFVAG